jgi:hypothetical protein
MELNMKPEPTSPLVTLQQELEFLDHGGYHKPVGYRQPLFCMESDASWRKRTIFEDSPSCPKEKYCACNPEGDCNLLSFVPREFRHETLPCHHIPLNDKGETIASLIEQPDRVEPALRGWLAKTIAKLGGSTTQSPR